LTGSIPIIIFTAFCVNATLALSFLVRFAQEKKPKFALNPVVYVIFASSFIWSVGMGFMSLQSDDRIAYFWRSVGILGTFIFMISVQWALAILANIKGALKWFLNFVSFLGIPIYLAYIQPGQTIFVHNAIGTTFYFKQGLVNSVYSAYFFIVSFNIFVTTIGIVIRGRVKRTVVAGKRIMLVELCIFVGAIFDMIVPSMGKAAIPGSAITHFWGVFIFWMAVHENYRSQITISNMSEYVYHSLNTPVLIFDSEYKIEIVNSASAEMFGLHTLDIAYANYEISDLFEISDELFRFDEKNRVTKAVCRATGANCDIEVNKIIDAYNDIAGYICLVNDLTEHELVISGLTQAKLAADSANTTKSMFLANMSHEIRTPMNAILGFSEIALMGNPDSKSKELFTEIQKAGNVLLTVINEILNFSKIELGKLELENDNYKSEKLIEDVEIITQSNANKKGLEFSVDIQENFPAVLHGDVNKIREVLLNILGNAVKYTQKGSVKLSASYEMTGEDRAIISFTVTDTGIGIKKEDFDTVFDKFSRVDTKLNSTTEGTGLGLSITKGLVDILGGNILLSSEYGVGSTFTIEIPQTVIAADESADEESKAGNNGVDEKIIDVSGKTFLVVDDNKVNLKVSSMFLARYGAEVETGLSGEEAIEKCKAKVYDLVFMDQMMPEMDGTEAMHHIRQIEGYEAGSAHKIVALTANAVNDVKESLLGEGFDDYISKPISKEELERVLDTWCS